MCKIEAGYFVVNGITPSETNYQALPTDKINIECWTSFDKNEIGKKYKAELKILLPNGKEFSYYTPLMVVNDNQIFDSSNFDAPIITGKYSTVWFVIYDENGNTVCNGHGKGLNCENLIVSEYIQNSSKEN